MHFVREKALVQRLGRSRSSIWRDVAAQLLPPPIRWGVRNLVWLESEVDTVAAAVVAGLTAAEIRAIVFELVQQRANALDVARANAQSSSPNLRSPQESSRTSREVSAA